MLKVTISLMLCLFLFTSELTCAEITDYKAVTWNMQGAIGSGGEDKWALAVWRSMMHRNTDIDVVALQEAGWVPMRAVPQDDRVMIISPPGSTRVTPYVEYVLNIGTSSSPELRFIYHAAWDQDGNRVNNAIVTTRRADDMVFVFNGLSPNGRPIIGVGFNRTSGPGRDYFFSMHASARRGIDVLANLNNIRQFFSGDQGVGSPGHSPDSDSQWLVLGDFNMEPDVLINEICQYPGGAGLSRDINIVSQPQITHVSLVGEDRNLDYAVAGRYNSNTQFQARLYAAIFAPGRRGVQLSDHFPVRFYPYGSQDFNSANLRSGGKDITCPAVIKTR